jgi:hypothetical protein
LASLFGTLFLVLGFWTAFLASSLIVLAIMCFKRLPGDTGRKSRAYLLILAIGYLASISLGLASSLKILGIGEGTLELLPAGIVLTLLSLVSLTPGNFGVREAVLAAVSPVLPAPLAKIIVASAIFVVARICLTFLIASSLRNHAWQNTGE